MSLCSSDPTRGAECGGLLCGGVPTDGRLVNVRAEAGPFLSATVLYGFDGDDPEGVRVLAYLDGVIAQSAGASAGEVGIPTLSAGDHSVELIVQRDRFEGAPDIAGNVDARRAMIRWAAVTAADVRSYNVYRNDGAGGSTYTIDGTVDEIGPDPTFREAVTSGTGTGTLTIGGVYDGAGENTLWRILIGAGATTFQVDPGTGSYGTAQALVTGVPVNIGSGMTALFSDDATLYAASDRWDFRVGPAREYLSGELDPGTYLFKVGAVDEPGNESALSSATTVIIDPAPKAPTNVAVTYSAGTFSASFTDPDDADLAELRLYTNFSVDFGDLDEGEVIYDSPVGTCAPDVNTIEFTPATVPNGDWQFVVRAVDDEGRESQNADVVTVTLPTASVGIGVPFAVSVTPIAAGKFTVSWQYDLEDDGDPDSPVTHFDIYINTSSSSPVFVTPLSSPAAVPGTGGVFSQEFTTASGYSTGAIRHFTVRARNATLSLASVNTDLHAGTADATAPSAPTGLDGMPE